MDRTRLPLRLSAGDQPFHAQSRKTKPYLPAGTLICAACGANFIVRAARNPRFGWYRYYGCAYHARRGTGVSPNRTLLPRADIERDLLELLQRVILTPATLERLLATVNARLRPQARAARPRVWELQRALAAAEQADLGSGELFLADPVESPPSAVTGGAPR